VQAKVDSYAKLLTNMKMPGRQTPVTWI
jgi:hypothetical protein